MGKNTSQIDRQLLIEQMNAESRALEASLKAEEQKSSRNGYYRPTGIEKYGQLAQDTGMLDASFGTGVGGQAYYQAVDFGSADAVTPFNLQGGPESVDAPQGPITPEMLAYEQNLQQGLEGYTDVYYQNVQKLNEMSALAASQGVNIKQPDPLDENQRNISNYYNQLYKETMHLADQLRQGYDAEQMRADKGYRALTHSGSAIGVPTKFENLAPDNLPSVERFNASIKGGGYTDYSAYKSELARYNAMKANLEEQRDQYEEAGQLDQVDRYNEFIEALKKPTYDGSVDKRLQLEREKMKNDQERWRAKSGIERKKQKSVEDVIFAVGNAFRNKASYKYDVSTGEVYNDSFTGMKWGGGIIDALVMTNPSNLSPVELSEYRTLLDKQARLKSYREKYLEESKNMNSDQKQAKLEEIKKLFNVNSIHLSDDETKRIKQLESLGANSMGDLVVRFTKTNTKGEGVPAEQKVSSARNFLRSLSTYNKETVDDETISLIGYENNWLNESGDWAWDDIIKFDYKSANKAFDAVIRAKEGDYTNLRESLAEFATNNQQFSRGGWEAFTDALPFNDEYYDGRNGKILPTSGTSLESLGDMRIYPSHTNGLYDITFGGTSEKNLGKENQIKTAVGKNVLKMMGKNVTEDLTFDEVNKFLELVKYVEQSPEITSRLMQINDINDMYRLNSERASTKNTVVEDETVNSYSYNSGNSGGNGKKRVKGF